MCINKTTYNHNLIRDALPTESLGAVFTSLHFLHNLQMGPISSVHGLNGLGGTNILAYWTNVLVTKEIKGCKYDPWTFELHFYS